MDVVRKNEFPSPYSGILFLSGCIPKKPKWAKYVSVPSFGDSFFIPRRRSSLQLSAVRVSVPSFGDSFFMVCIERTSRLIMMRFPSPHSGILFLFYYHLTYHLYLFHVSVPSFGDSFFIIVYDIIKNYVDCFRPLIRGFFFYPMSKVAVIDTESGFPSPHSGILFLLPYPLGA